MAQKRVTNDNYFSAVNNTRYCGASQYKAFMRCQAKALAVLRGEWDEPKSTALLVGSYIDAYFEGTLEQFKTDHPELFKKDGTLKADYEQAEQIIARITRDEMFMRYMSGKKQVIKTGKIEGVSVKIKMDSYHKGKAIVDLKIVKDLEPIYENGIRKNFINYWGYDIQAAFYQTIEGNNLPFYLAVATKEKDTDIAIIQIPQMWISEALQRIKYNLPIIDAIKRGKIEPERCECCDYCRATKKLNRIIQADELEGE